MESTPLPLSQQAIANKRREKDIMKLMVSEYQVTVAETPTSTKAPSTEFFVKLRGPPDSPYEGVSYTILIRVGSVVSESHPARVLPV